MVSDFETHPVGTGERLKMLEDELTALKEALAQEHVVGTLKGPDIRLGEAIVAAPSFELVLRCPPLSDNPRTVDLGGRS